MKVAGLSTTFLFYEGKPRALPSDSLSCLLWAYAHLDEENNNDSL